MRFTSPSMTAAATLAAVIAISGAASAAAAPTERAVGAAGPLGAVPTATSWVLKPGAKPIG